MKLQELISLWFHKAGRYRGLPPTTRAPTRSSSPGGTIAKAIVDVSGEPFIDLEKEAIAMMARK